HNFSQTIHNNKDSKVEGSYTESITKYHKQEILGLKDVRVGAEYLTNVALSKDTIVGLSHTLNIGENNKLRVGKDSSEYVGGDKRVEVGGNFKHILNAIKLKRLMTMQHKLCKVTIIYKLTKICKSIHKVRP
ncbi:MAG: hypothetical protein SPJ16_03620, partial [Helicobacter sp.]|nr:hypothetical protein [Helicobacter sp.]